ncbi:MAG: TIGR01906 family membrane protein [Bacilli bacterium]
MTNRWGFKALDQIVLVAMTVAVLILVLYLSLMPLALNRSFYHEQFVQNHSSEAANMSLETLDQVINHVLTYLEDKHDNMQIVVETLDHQSVNAFRDREIQHMVDVKVLFIEGRRIARIALFFLGVALAYLAYRQKHIIRTWAKVPLFTLVGFFAIVFAVGIYALFDFYGVFEAFHHIFFSNDLWLLDYNDLLIIMLPESLFSTIAFRTLSTFVASLVAAIIGFSLLYHRQRHQLHHNDQ